MEITMNCLLAAMYVSGRLRRGQPSAGSLRCCEAARSRGLSPTGRIQRYSPVFRSTAVIRPYGSLTKGEQASPLPIRDCMSVLETTGVLNRLF